MEKVTTLKTTVIMLAALAQETRLALFRLLIRHGPDGLKAGEIARALHVPNSTLSYHLTELERAGLIISTKKQRHIIYKTNLEQLDSFLSFLVEDCCHVSGDACFPFLEKTDKAQRP